MSGLNSVRRIKKDLRNGCIFRPDAFTKAEGSRMNFEFKKSQRRNSYLGGRSFVGPPIRLFGGFGAGAGGVKRLIGRDGGDDFDDPDFGIAQSSQRW
jgi:hypothetical protein